MDLNSEINSWKIEPLNIDKPKDAYNKQINICIIWLRKVKRNCFRNLDTEGIKKNKQFWKKRVFVIVSKLFFKIFNVTYTKV